MSEDDILDELLGDEGEAITCDPADAGGITKFGVTLPYLSEYYRRQATDEELCRLTHDEAREVHREMAIVRPGYRQIHDETIRAFVIDMAVLEGRELATRIVQDLVDVNVDGHFGPITAREVNAADSQLLLRALIKARMHHLLDCMVARLPQDTINSSNLKWRHGWWNRVAEFL